MKKDDSSINGGSGTIPVSSDVKDHLRTTTQKEDPDAPPGYTAEEVGPPPDIAAAFAKLDLSSSNENAPTPDECIAHLKLLEAIAQLREDVGSTDGLYGLFDHLADSADEPAKVKGKLREKRWAIYVVQAAQRFERWFQSVEEVYPMTTLQEMESTQYPNVHKSREALRFTAESLPPLDVLMVWHTFILNPRKFLSDCIRHNKIGLWRAGMPWAPIVASIDNSSFAYNPGNAAQQAFTSATKLEWDGLTAAPARQVPCPRCRQTVAVELTTCIALKDWQHSSSAGEGGHGYADNDFSFTCPSCALKLDHDVLRAQRFRRDLQQLLVHNVPMPGTLLSISGMTPSAISNHGLATNRDNNTFRMSYPNRLLLSGGGARIANVTELTNENGVADLKGHYSVDDIRKTLEACMGDRNIRLKASVNGISTNMFREEKIAIRRMMSCYWEDASIFSLDLAGAVVRQNVFVQKMHDIDWLHSPAVRSTMERLIKKYLNFFRIMAAHPKEVAVPTLDVDLAWHTHQLAPPSYRSFAVVQTSVFIDHDDKIDENKLSTSFEWTSKTYEKMFGAVYSECTCWYCEAIRESHSTTMSRLFKSSRDPVAAQLDRLHRSDPTDPHRSPHISAHNAIKSQRNPDVRTARYVQQQQLERNYQKAVQRARKQGRRAPDRDAYAYYPYWGMYYPMPFYAPYMGDPCISGGMYPANPGCANFGAGAVGNCCAGACGGNVAIGGCAGGAASCGGGAAGAACGGGGGGGGCGGGGGGGCGGGGGGGGCGGGGGG